jgi:uncharacterized membrane protein YgdD (TMEM256/DUF423 family)
MNKRFLIAGAAFAGIAVVLGAFGAHALQKTLTEENLRVFHTAVEYQFYHSLALLLTGIIAERIASGYITWAGNLFIAGILLFCCSLYCLAAIPGLMWIGIVTPFGGLCFIGGWISLIIGMMKKR